MFCVSSPTFGLSLLGVTTMKTSLDSLGGHSYGSFMTAHLLSHTSLFSAGVGRSGAFNRTLTP